ncbi:MAG: hypothetical protein HY919_04580 [Elusimicrobia bacterium]|nr:hypothetical protein [Elusimicrobiota bacterium]
MKKIISVVIISLMFQLSTVYAGQVEKAIQKLHKNETRQEAIKEIEKIGKPAIPQLRQLAKDRKSEQNARVSAIILLGRMKAEESGIALNPVKLD